MYACYLGNWLDPRQISFPVWEMQNPHAQLYMAHAKYHQAVKWSGLVNFHIM